MSEHAERVTHALARDLTLPGGLGTMVLVTLDNGLDHTKPSTLGPLGIAELTATLAAVRERCRAGEVAAVAVTGKPYVFVAGADLTQVGSARTRDDALALARNGHAAYGLLADLGVPTFAFVNGVALGGGLELALACDYRTVGADVRALALPETGLGLVPGWGGAYRVPRLVGVVAALDVILSRPAANKPYSAAEAAGIGLVDVVLDAADFLEESVRWATRVLSGEVVVPRRPLDDEATWRAAIAAARARLDAVVHGSRPAPYRALALIESARTATEAEAFAAEDEALADLVMSDEMRASVYAFGLVRGGKRPVGAPDPASARPVTKVGIVGAGLMAAQIAVLVARKLGVPVVLRDLDEAKVAHGLAAVRNQVERLARRGRVSPDDATRLVGSINASTDLAALAGCDLVIEAVSEVLTVKQKVFAQVEEVVGEDAVLATNTSALSVTAMASGLRHPERVVGLHFFNPVAAMPLIEVVQAEQTDEPALATAFAVSQRLGKTAVLVRDRPGFAVNRLLVLLLGVVLDSVQQGTPVQVADRALNPLGLPMPPFELVDLVGPAVALHVLDSLRDGLGEAFPASPTLAKVVADGTRIVLDAPAPGLPKPVDPALQDVVDATIEVGSPRHPLDEAGVLDAVLTALTLEVGRMLDEGVVATPQQLDQAMILGAGWPFHLGGLTPYLDRTGYSERLLGRRLLPPGTADVVRA